MGADHDRQIAIVPTKAGLSAPRLLASSRRAQKLCLFPAACGTGAPKPGLSGGPDHGKSNPALFFGMPTIAAHHRRGWRATHPS